MRMFSGSDNEKYDDGPLFGRNWLEDERIYQPTSNQFPLSYEDRTHLKWIYNRLIEVHKENPNIDYMIRFKKIIEKL